MGKIKEQQQQSKKFDRNVEISAPILDPEIIKAIHTPPKEQRLDLKHGGFKALLSDLNSQDSTDEPQPITERHVPSYIGISCTVSGYSGYSSYGKKTTNSNLEAQASTRQTNPAQMSGNAGQTSTKYTLNRSRAISPVARKPEPQVHHVTIDKSNILSADHERRQLTEKLTASATERRRSPSPCIPPTEEDRHHGAYVGARYCPLPPPSKLVNKHIPLLGIDDDQDPDVVAATADKENKVEQTIASLYGDKYVEDWKESIAHKKEQLGESMQYQAPSARDKLHLVEQTPPQQTEQTNKENQQQVDLVSFSPEPQQNNHTAQLNQQQYPSQEVQKKSITSTVMQETTVELVSHQESTISDIKLDSCFQSEIQSDAIPKPQLEQHSNQSHLVQLDKSPELKQPNQEFEVGTDTVVFNTDEKAQLEPISGQLVDLEHDQDRRLEVENSLADCDGNPSESPHEEPQENNTRQLGMSVEAAESASETTEKHIKTEATTGTAPQMVSLQAVEPTAANDGHYYLDLLEKEKSFIKSEVERAEKILEQREKKLEADQGNGQSVSESEQEAIGNIRSAIGKAFLLVNKKFNQFKELCEANINAKEGEQYATLNEDLAGFWDLLSIQVSDVHKSFENLWLSYGDCNPST